MAKVDVRTVSVLECKAPGSSTKDSEYLKQKLQSGEIFGVFSSNFRQQIWSRLRVTEGLIPTLSSFFDDLKYFQSCAGCIKKLFTVPYKGTLYSTVEESFVDKAKDRDLCIIQDSETTFDTRKGRHFDRIDLHYRQLFLYVMRHLHRLAPEAVLVETKKVDRKPRATKDPDRSAFSGLADLAMRLGFETNEIRALQSNTPAPAKARTKPGTPPLMTSGPGEDRVRRSGRPFALAHEQSRSSLFFDHVHSSDRRQGVDLTPFAVRKYIYLAFFGRPEIPQLRNIPMNNSPRNHIAPPTSNDILTRVPNESADHGSRQAEEGAPRTTNLRFDEPVQPCKDQSSFVDPANDGGEFTSIFAPVRHGNTAGSRRTWNRASRAAARHSRRRIMKHNAGEAGISPNNSETEDWRSHAPYNPLRQDLFVDPALPYVNDIQGLLRQHLYSSRWSLMPLSPPSKDHGQALLNAPTTPLGTPRPMGQIEEPQRSGGPVPDGPTDRLDVPMMHNELQIYQRSENHLPFRRASSSYTGNDNDSSTNTPIYGPDISTLGNSLQVYQVSGTVSKVASSASTDYIEKSVMAGSGPQNHEGWATRSPSMVGSSFFGSDDGADQATPPDFSPIVGREATRQINLLTTGQLVDDSLLERELPERPIVSNEPTGDKSVPRASFIPQEWMGVESERLVRSAVQHNQIDRAGTPTSIRFIFHLDKDQFNEQTYAIASFGQSRIQQEAEKYLEKGWYPFSSKLWALHSSECLRVSRADGTNTVVFLQATKVDINQRLCDAVAQNITMQARPVWA